MYLIAMGWLYVVGMVAIITVVDTNGGWLRAVLIWLFAGMLPMGLLYYLGGYGRRQRLRRQAEKHAPPAATAEADTAIKPSAPSSESPTKPH